MRVYRIEHKFRKYALMKNERALPDSVYQVYEGVYRGKKQLNSDSYEHIRMLPPPNSDWFDSYHYVFAFRTVEAMLEWFPTDIMQELRSMGYVVAVYEVPLEHTELDYHGIQLAYDPNYAKKVHRHRWSGERTVQKLAA